MNVFDGRGSSLLFESDLTGGGGVGWIDENLYMNIKTESSALTRKLKALDKQVDCGRGPFPKSAFTWVISGGKGSGKSTLLLNILESQFRGHFDKIWLISPTASRDPKFDRLLKELKDQHVSEYSDAMIKAIMDDCQEEIEESKKDKEPLPNFLIIFDDCLADLPPRQMKGSELNRLITCHRHIRATVIILTQKYNALNTLLRSNLDCISMFQTACLAERKCFLGDLTDGASIEPLYDFAAYDAANHFLHVNNKAPKAFRYFKLFDRIRTDDGDEEASDCADGSRARSRSRSPRARARGASQK